MPIKTSYISIVITYNPNIDQLFKLVKTLIKQGSKTIIVDNNSNSNLRFKIKEELNLIKQESHFIELSENYGIARAQNIGIEIAKEYDPEFILFFDQDSDPSESLISDLLKAYNTLKSGGKKIGILGPRYTDPRQNNPPPFLRVSGLRLHRCPCNNDDDIVPVDYLISSGSLISIDALRIIGGMREDLFIDYVDIEWGLRAKYNGYQNFGVCDARMNHSLGDNPKFFFGKNIPIHSPLRHYYHFRNAILLYKEGWIELNWKIVDGFRLLLKYIYYSIFTNSPYIHFFYITKGLFHGIMNRTGKY